MQVWKKTLDSLPELKPASLYGSLVLLPELLFIFFIDGFTVVDVMEPEVDA